MNNLINKINSIIHTCRPRQWTKNFLCTSAVLITPFDQNSNLLNLFLTTISFIFASSFIYLINDIVDKKSDQEHPTKKNRPIASGKLRIWEALVFSIILLIFAIITSINININIFFLIVSYISLQLIYCFWAKNKSLLDIYFIASGFIIRACAGVVSLNSNPSPWFLTTAGCFALFLAIQKRKSELIRVMVIEKNKFSSRKVLKAYSSEFLDKIEMLSVNSGFLSYMLWSSGPILNGAKSSQMLITCPILLIGIFRYLLICNKSKKGILVGESPTRILFTDKGIQFVLISWSFVTWLIIHNN